MPPRAYWWITFGFMLLVIVKAIVYDMASMAFRAMDDDNVSPLRRFMLWFFLPIFLVHLIFVLGAIAGHVFWPQ